MIIVSNKPLDVQLLLKEYPDKSIEINILNALSVSDIKFTYDSMDELKFELRLRHEIIRAADALHNSRMSFQTFRNTTCNPEFWVRMDDGGFALKEGVKPSDAVNDIFKNSAMYGTECATAMMIVYYKALLAVFPEEAYNTLFTRIYLMNWHRIEKELREVGLMQESDVFLPGDRMYFNNPDVSPLVPEFQGENVIVMGDDHYYGHGIGKYKADVFINELNNQRKQDAKVPAYLMTLVGRPHFKRLFDIYKRVGSDGIESMQIA